MPWEVAFMQPEGLSGWDSATSRLGGTASGVGPAGWTGPAGRGGGVAY